MKWVNGMVCQLYLNNTVTKKPQKYKTLKNLNVKNKKIHKHKVKSNIVTLKSGKVDFKARCITKDKKGHLTVIK